MIRCELLTYEQSYTYILGKMKTKIFWIEGNALYKHSIMVINITRQQTLIKKFIILQMMVAMPQHVSDQLVWVVLQVFISITWYFITFQSFHTSSLVKYFIHCIIWQHVFQSLTELLKKSLKPDVYVSTLLNEVLTLRKVSGYSSSMWSVLRLEDDWGSLSGSTTDAGSWLPLRDIFFLGLPSSCCSFRFLEFCSSPSFSKSVFSLTVLLLKMFESSEEMYNH